MSAPSIVTLPSIRTPGIRSFIRVEAPEQSGFAAAGGAYERGDAPPQDRHVHVLERVECAVAQVEAGYRDADVGLVVFHQPNLPVT